MGSLDQRLSTEKIPSEILPLVETINQALSRLDEGVSRNTQFLANVAHELRTPVMIFSARANGVEKPTFRQDVQRDARRMRNIVEQLLSFARLGRLERARPRGRSRRDGRSDGRRLCSARREERQAAGI